MPLFLPYKKILTLTSLCKIWIIFAMKKLILFFIFLSVIGCSSASRSSLRIAFTTHPTTIDPRKSGDFVSSTLICLLFEGLTRCKSGDEIENALAERIEISHDQKTYLFHLRKSFWNDGYPVTAYDFEAAWKKVLTPGFPSLCAYLFYPILNAEKYAKGLVSGEEVGIRALDDQTLQVQLERPTPYFLSLTAFPLYLPIPSHIENPFSMWDRNTNSQIVCNGPFCIENIVLNSEISLKKNPSFWNAAQVRLQEIQISIVAEETTSLQMFERDELDMIGGPLSPLPPDALQNLKCSSHIRYIPMAASTFCTFNIETFPFQNHSLRKAFSFAIDRDLMVQEIAQLGQIPASRCLPPSFFGPLKPVLLKSDPEIARSYLKQALQEMQIEPAALETITLYYKSGQIDKRLAQALQRQWKDILGVQIQLEQLDPKIFLQHLHERNYQLSLASWIAQFHDPINLLERFKNKSNRKNYPGWENESYIHLLEQASETLNPQERLQILESAEEILAEQTIIAPLYHWSSPTLFNPRVQNFTTTSSGGILFERCSISSEG